MLSIVYKKFILSDTTMHMFHHSAFDNACQWKPQNFPPPHAGDVVTVIFAHPWGEKTALPFRLYHVPECAGLFLLRIQCIASGFAICYKYITSIRVCEQTIMQGSRDDVYRLKDYAPQHGIQSFAFSFQLIEKNDSIFSFFTLAITNQVLLYIIVTIEVVLEKLKLHDVEK